MTQSRTTTTYRIVSRYFVAGVDVQHGVVVYTAPILRYMRGWRVERLLSYAAKQGWEAAEIPNPTQEDVDHGYWHHERVESKGGHDG